MCRGATAISGGLFRGTAEAQLPPFTNVLAPFSFTSMSKDRRSERDRERARERMNH